MSTGRRKVMAAARRYVQTRYSDAVVGVLGLVAFGVGLVFILNPNGFGTPALAGAFALIKPVVWGVALVGLVVLLAVVLRLNREHAMWPTALLGAAFAALSGFSTAGATAGGVPLAPVLYLGVALLFWLSTALYAWGEAAPEAT